MDDQKKSSTRSSISTSKTTNTNKTRKQQQQSKNTNNNNNLVLFQKVIRSPPNIPDILFLGYLIEYLQEKYELPNSQLPMIYEKHIPTTSIDDNNNNNNNNDSIIVQFNSPLSPLSEKTCLNVKVIAIVTDNNDEERNNYDNDNVSSSKSTLPKVPTMAMVIIDKKKKTISSTSTTTDKQLFPPMLEGLFHDSEKKIMKHLDRGLDEFMFGKIQFLDTNSNSLRTSSNQQDLIDEMLTEIIQDDDEIIRKNNDDDVDDDDITVSSSSKEQLEKTIKQQQPLPGYDSMIDADIIQRNGINTTDDNRLKEKKNHDKKTKLMEQREAVLKTMNPTISSHNVTNEITRKSSSGLEFAIQAAKEAAAKRGIKNNKEQQQQQQQQQTIQEVEEENVVEDFAVAAARKKKIQADNKKSSATKKKKKDMNVTTSKRIDKKQSNKLNNESTPTAFTEQQQQQQELQSFSSNKSPMLDSRISGVRRTFMTTISTPKDYQKHKNNSKSTLPTSKKQSKSPKSSSTASTKQLKSLTTKDISDETTNNIAKQNTNTNVESEKSNTYERLVESAQDALTEMAEAGKDMTPEEILADVMKFGEQRDNEEATGTGFVRAAFEKAKDILREQKLSREQRLQPIPEFGTTTNGDVTNNFNTNVKEITPNEELRRMFEAGERLAESRIDLTSKPYSSESKIRSGSRTTTEEEIDSIIESDKTVSQYARVLDDELVELQIRINKSPDEVYDGPDKNPLFDIFSGPEVYDRNVDPETAVNWPGARTGTREIRLPKELDEAVKHAKFAAELLMSIKEEDASISDNGEKIYKVGNRELSENQIRKIRSVVEEAVQIGLIDNPLDIVAEKARLQMLLDELWDQPEERFRDITFNFKDLLLSDYFVPLIKVRLNEMAERDLDALRRGDRSLESIHAKERDILGQIVTYAQLLIKEARALGAELEVQQIEIIRSICKVAMDPSHQTEEETALALTDAVSDMRPLFDDAFVAYLKYAVAEEEGRLARAGLLGDPERNQWLYVLKIVQQGVYAELAKSINRYIEHIWYVLRMETPVERRRLLEKLIDVMPTLDVRPFVQVVNNIVGSLGDGVRGDFDGVTPLGEMTNKLLQLHRDMNELLPPERITEKSRDADEWVARRKKRLMEQRNVTRQRLKAAQDTEYLDAEIESFGKRGEVDRFD